MSRRDAFTSLDVVLALSLTAVMAGVLVRAVHDQRRAALASARVRHAVDALELAAATLRAGETPDAAIEVAVSATPGWLRLTPAGTDHPALLVLAPKPGAAE